MYGAPFQICHSSLRQACITHEVAHVFVLCVIVFAHKLTLCSAEGDVFRLCLSGITESQSTKLVFVFVFGFVPVFAFTFSLCSVERCILSVHIRHNRDSLPSLYLYSRLHSHFHCAQWREVFCLCASDITETVYLAFICISIRICIHVCAHIFIVLSGEMYSVCVYPA